jgi:hypothetical protein
MSLIASLALATIIVSTSSSSVSTTVSASGGSSASASSHVTTNGSESVVEVTTVVDGVEKTERYESEGEDLIVSVHASSTTVSTSSEMTSETEERIVTRVVNLIERILSFFGLRISSW